MTRSALLALAFVAVGSVAVDALDRADPHTAYVVWDDGKVERVPATSAETCAAQLAAIQTGRLVLVGREHRSVVEFTCRRENSFQPNWHCIKGYNC